LFTVNGHGWLTRKQVPVTLPSFAASSNSAATPPSPAALQLLVGQDHYAGGRVMEAIAAFRRGIDLARADGSGTEMVSELHAKLGNACMVAGDLGLAAVSYKAALKLSPHLASCWCNLGTIHLKTGRAQDAIALYLEALKLNPAHWASRSNLAEALIATRQFLIAKALLLELAEERPLDGKIRHRLGRACFELNETQSALEHFHRAVAIDANDADSLYWIGGVSQKLGDLDAAQGAYTRAARIQPLIRRPAAKSPADFRLLALYAPFAGNTPADYLFKDAGYEVDTLALLGDDEPDIASLGHIDLVVNLVSDADQAEAVLPQASRLVEKLALPVINDPGRIKRTTRDAVAALLPGIAGCRIPQILRLDAGADVSAAALSALVPFSCPVLGRPAGTHGGDDFEKFDDFAALSDFLKTRQGEDHYVLEYVDYASRDGHFRKYRFIFAGDEILPYHLAIGGGWKVHHVSTDMVNQPWMQQEEAAFLADPGAVFSAAHYRVLREVRARVGLDYFGIDCALDQRGDLLVFEVNASMLVHDDNAEFPYKDPHVRAIKAAFEAMLRERAQRTSARDHGR
jgi:tetratricopeptide (TPR) repeat protein